MSEETISECVVNLQKLFQKIVSDFTVMKLEMNSIEDSVQTLKVSNIIFNSYRLSIIASNRLINQKSER